MFGRINIHWASPIEDKYDKIFEDFIEAVKDYDFEAVKTFVPEYDFWGNEIYNLINRTSKKYPQTALMYACSEHKGRQKYAIDIGLIGKDDNLPQYLIDNGANVNIEANRRTPLLIACIYNDIELVKLLVNNGANINKVIDNGNIFIPMSPIYYATKLAENGKPELLDYLFSTGKLDKNTKEYGYLMRNSNNPKFNIVLKKYAIMNINQNIYDKYGTYLEPNVIADMNEYIGGKQKTRRRKTNGRKRRKSKRK